MARRLACALVTIGLAAAAPRPATGQEGAAAAELRPGEPVPAVPVHDEPHHRQLFQKGPMRLLELQLPGGDTSWFHSHEWPVLYVTLSQGQLRTQNLGEEWGGGRAGGGRRGNAEPAAGRGAAAGRSTAGAPAGRGAGPRPTSTTSYADRPVTHRIQNAGTGLVRALVVVNETSGDEGTSEAAAGFTGTPELSNRWFRAYRVALEPGRRTGAHRHRAPVAIIQATAGKGIGEGPMAFEFNEPGQWAYFDPDVPHELRNVGEGAVEFIEVEVRRK